MSLLRSFVFAAATDEQRLLKALLRSNDIVLVSGAAGTGKTHAALALALEWLSSGKCRRLMLTRPAVPCGENLGFLPGTLEEKCLPWLGPFRDVLANAVHDPPAVLAMKEIEVVPLAYMRGRSIDHAIGILDEAQNCTLPQLRMYLSRLGAGGKLIVCGDVEQSDVGGGFARVLSALSNLDGVAVLTMQGPCLRHPLIPEILRRLR